MIKGYIIYSEFEANRNKFFIDKLIEHSKKNDIDVKLLIFEKLNIKYANKNIGIIYDDIKLDNPDFVIARVMNYHLVRLFEIANIRVFNNSNISKIADNKYLTYLEMKNNNIEVLPTILDNDITNENLFFPNVTKPIDSKGGNRVFLNNNYIEYENSIKKYDRYIVQGASSLIGHDLRVYVIGNKIITSILRINNNGFLSNFCRGGDAKLYELTYNEREIVENIINIIKPDYVGIDFLFNDGSIVLNEIENVVGARMVYSITDIDIAKLFIEYILSEMSKKIA